MKNLPGRLLNKASILLGLAVTVIGVTHARSFRVVNAESFTDGVSPGSTVSIFGANLSTQTAAAAGPRIALLSTPNGDSRYAANAANVFTID
jgi:hypothetical protein